MKNIFNHIKQWFLWTRYNRNSFSYKLCVLFGLANSPTFDMTYKIRDKINEFRKNNPSWTSVKVRIYDGDIDEKD